MNGGGNRDRPPGSSGASSILELLHRWSMPVVYSAASVSVGGCVEMLSQAPGDAMQGALEQQEQSGWNVGGEWKPLVFRGARETDITGGTNWRAEMTTMSLRLAPASGRWTPYYNPALFQSLEAPRNFDLRAIVRPIFTHEMWMAWRRGEALRALLTENGACRTDVALVLDLPGPEAIAAAAGLGSCADPVFVFANWPHPLGVVPAHLTLAAALYFLPSFEKQRAGRAATAPPAFVLDRTRLASYVDDSNHFDNRYLAGLPPVEALRAAGIRHVLYVTPDDQVTLESDDLNDDLVAIDAGGVDVKMLALSDFAETPLPDWPRVPSCVPAPPPASSPAATTAAKTPPLFFGGSPEAQSCFPYWYGWQEPMEPIPGAPPATTSQPVNTFSLSFGFPQRLAPRCQFHPTARATFSLAGHGSGLGSGFRGSFGGGGFGRSGSLGRVHSGGFG